MASTTIHTLSYKMVADTQNFTRGLISSRSEVALMKKLMNDTSPEQKSAKAMAAIEKLLQSGKISLNQYNQAAAKIKAELDAIQRAAKPAGERLDNFGSSLNNIAAAYLSIQTAQKGAQLFITTLDKLDAQQDNASRFGMVVDDFIRLQFALTKGGEISADSVPGAIAAMRDNLQLAAMDMGRFKEIFSQLGADQDVIAAVSFMPVKEQFETMVDMISRIPDAGKRGLITQKLFGTDEGQMNSLMAEGLSGIQKLYDESAKFGMLQGKDAAAISKAADDWKEVGLRWEVVVKQFTVALLPIAERLAEIARALFGNNEQVRLASGGDNPGLRIVRQAESMAAMTQESMVKFQDNKGFTTRRVRGNLDANKLISFFAEAQKFDPNFAEQTLTPDQRSQLFKSALPGNSGGNQESVQLAILEELKKQTQASAEMVRQQEEKSSQTRNVAGLVE